MTKGTATANNGETKKLLQDSEEGSDAEKGQGDADKTKKKRRLFGFGSKKKVVTKPSEGELAETFRSSQKHGRNISFVYNCSRKSSLIPMSENQEASDNVSVKGPPSMAGSITSLNTVSEQAGSPEKSKSVGDVSVASAETGKGKKKKRKPQLKLKKKKGQPDPDEEQNASAEKQDTADTRLGKRLKDPTKGSSSKKEKYQIRIKVVEGRSLMGSDLNPVCRVSLCNVTKQTRVKRHTNSPWWDEIFFFQAEMMMVDLFSEAIEFQDIPYAKSAGLYLQQMETLEQTMPLDVGVVHDQHNHAFINKWLLLSNPEDTMAGVLGYLKVSIAVLGPGDDCPSLKATKHNEEEDMESNLLLPAGVQLKPASFILDLFQGEDLPRMDTAVFEGVKRMLHMGDDTKELVDPYFILHFAGRENMSVGIKFCLISPNDLIWESVILSTELLEELTKVHNGHNHLCSMSDANVDDMVSSEYCVTFLKLIFERYHFLLKLVWLTLLDYEQKQLQQLDCFLGLPGLGRSGHEPVVESKVMYSNDHPQWEQRLYLGFQFPSVCESIKLILKDWDRVTEDDTIATAFIHLPLVSAPGESGYLPTFGPCFLNFYGSPREYSELGSEFEALDEGKGEGCAYRGRCLISLSTSLGAYPETPIQAFENEDLLKVQPYCRRRRYRLHAAFIDAMMVSIVDGPVEFEVSIGNFGNKFEDTMVPSPSTTQPTNAVFDGCQYYFLPWKETKPCVVINSQWEDISFRLDTVNILLRIGETLQENALEIRKMLDQAKPIPQVAIKFIAAMDLLVSQTRVSLPEAVPGQHVENDLDRLLREQRMHELKYIHNQAVNLRENATDIEEALKDIEVFINTLRALAVEPQNSMPDIIIWMLSGKKRIAYYRIPAYEILYSPKEECQGKFCGKLRTITLKLPDADAQDRKMFGAALNPLNMMKGITPEFKLPGLPGLPVQYPGMNKNVKLLQIPMLLRLKMWFGLEINDGAWCKSQNDAELAVFAETYENQVNFLGNWTTKGPTMSRPPFSDASGSLALPKDKFLPPPGWKFDIDWFINPEPSMLYDEDAGHKSFLEDVFENQYRLPAFSWQASSNQWTDVRGDTTLPIQDIHPPVGWVWDDAWQIDLNRAVDEEGWEYAVEATLGGYSPVEHTYHLCRRRRWVRMRTFIKDLKVTESGETDVIGIENDHSSGKSELVDEGWEYAPLFNLKFHAKERRMDLVRRRRWHRKLVAEDTTAPLVFNMGEAKQKMTGRIKQMIGMEKEGEGKQSVLSCPRLFLIYKDPFACVSFMNQSKKTEVIPQTLCPTWDQTLFFDEVVIFGDKDAVSTHPPLIVIEVYDRDIVGEPEFLGRCTVRPIVHLDPEKAVAPRMEWNELNRGKQFSGEILASFELFLDEEKTLPFLPSKKGNLFIVPSGIRPVLQRTGIEILCWGVRNMKTYEFTNIQSPSIEFECGEKVIKSNVIRDIKFNPNFDNPVIFFEMLLPREDLYMPAIHIKVRDHRQFGRKPIVGTHLIRSLFEYRCKPIKLEELPDNIPAGVTETPMILPDDEIEDEEDSLLEHAKEPTVLLNDIFLVRQQFSAQNKAGANEVDESIDWWSKYYASVNELDKAGQYLEKGYETVEVFPVPLERIDPFQKFQDFLHTYNLYRGKTKESEESAVVGEFKGTFRVYDLPGDPNAPLPPKALRGLPALSSEDIIVRVYIVRANDLAPKDPNGLSDPFVTIKMGRKKADSRDNYRPNTVNPIFGHMFELRGSLPLDKDLTVSIKDYDLVGSDDLIGETVIDLENRYLTKYRATCGLPKQYYISGPNIWRDGRKPREILGEVCDLQNLPTPHFYSDFSVSIGKKLYTLLQFGELISKAIVSLSEPDFLPPTAKLAAAKVEEEPSEPPNPHLGPPGERIALHVLNTMGLAPEHVETRPLFSPMMPGLEQGKIEMWVDIFPKSICAPGPAININPRIPKKFELRIAIWNTYDVLLNDINVLGEQMSDIYVKACISGLDDVQKTDIHYRSMDGEGNFNWRFVFPFEYLVAEQSIVVKKKAHFWSLDATELHVQPKISLQIWDNDLFSSDDFIGEIELDLTRMPIPEKERLSVEKLEVEMEIVTEDEIEKRPVGLGRDEPNANPTLEPPKQLDLGIFLKSIEKQREAQEQQLLAMIFEKRIIFERLFVQSETLNKELSEQNELIEQFMLQR
ncbi:Dysferlin [Nymphon striatum]|nr:Dysferlin [Nymphon striatum]